MSFVNMTAAARGVGVASKDLGLLTFMEHH